MNKKIKVGIFFGGKSAEHEVSLQSARNVYKAIDKERFEPVLIFIDKDGRWFLVGNDEKVFMEEEARKDGKEVVFPVGRKGLLVKIDGGEISKIDVAFPVLHGTFGEDGTLQGLFELANVPFVGASVLGSSVGMDKEATKRVLRDNGIPIADFVVVKRDKETPSYNNVAEKFGTPFFVKPANMGSSVGVYKVEREEDYKKAIDGAFLYDNKIIIEEFVKGREIECSVLGNENPKSSKLGEVIPQKDFYSYDAKYISEDGAELVVPVELEKEAEKKMRKVAVSAFSALYCEGFARVDFFLKEDGSVIVNEINTIPGFTKISMYPKLWEVSGLSYPKLITYLIGLAIKKHKRDEKLKTTFKD